MGTEERLQSWKALQERAGAFGAVFENLEGVYLVLSGLLKRH